MARLEGKVCVITGAASGIGAETARLFLEEGATVVGVDLGSDGAGTIALAADVADEEQVARLYARVRADYGRIDVLFNNAGVVRVQPLLDVTEAEWDRVMTVNLRAVFFVMQAVIRRMRDQSPMPGGELRGKLIQTASIAAYRGGNPLMTPYSASKAGVVRIHRLTVRLTDVNGPRGGLDKRCRIAVALVPRGVVMVEGSGDDPFALVAGAAERAGRAVRRELERRRGRILRV